MAKSLLGSVNGDVGANPPLGLPPPPDPRSSGSTPAPWDSASKWKAQPAVPGAEVLPDAEELPPTNWTLWKRVKRHLFFWQAARDCVQVSIFAPAAVTPGSSVKLTAYLHLQEAAESVRTLSRAIQHDAELIGSGFVSSEVARGTELAVHLAVANVAIIGPVIPFVWQAQPHRVAFDLHVPWESPEGPSPAVLSIAADKVRIGRIVFSLHVLPRKA